MRSRIGIALERCRNKCSRTSPAYIGIFEKIYRFAMPNTRRSVTAQEVYIWITIFIYLCSRAIELIFGRYRRKYIRSILRDDPDQLAIDVRCGQLAMFRNIRERVFNLPFQANMPSIASGNRIARPATPHRWRSASPRTCSWNCAKVWRSSSVARCWLAWMIA